MLREAKLMKFGTAVTAKKSAIIKQKANREVIGPQCVTHAVELKQESDQIEVSNKPQWEHPSNTMCDLLRGTTVVFIMGEHYSCMHFPVFLQAEGLCCPICTRK